MSGLGNLDLSGLGAGLPQGGSGAAGFLSSLLSGFHQEREGRQEAQLNALKISDAQKAAASQQYDRLMQVLKTNQTMQQDPKMIAQVQRLSRILGYPDPTVQQETATALNPTQAPGGGAASSLDPGKQGVRGNQPKDGPMVSGNANLTHFDAPPLERETKPAVGMSIASPPVSFDMVDEKTKEYWSTLPPGPIRDAAMTDVANVPPAVRSAPQAATQKDRTAIMNQVSTVMRNFGRGWESNTAAVGQLKGLFDQAKNAGQDLTGLINDVSNGMGVGPETQANIAKMMATTKNDNARDAYIREKTVEEPDRFKAWAYHEYGMTDAATKNAESGSVRAAADAKNADTRYALAQFQAQALITNANAHMSEAQTAAGRLTVAQDALQFAQTSFLAKELDKNISDISKDEAALSKTYDTLALNGDPEAPITDAQGNTQPSIGDQLRSLRQVKATLVAKQKAAAQFAADGGAQTKFRQGSGNGSVQMYDPGTTPPPNTAGARWQLFTGNGGKQMKIDTSTGNTYPADGDPSSAPADPHTPVTGKIGPDGKPVQGDAAGGNHTDPGATADGKVAAIIPPGLPVKAQTAWFGMTKDERIAKIKEGKIPHKYLNYFMANIDKNLPMPHQTDNPQQPSADPNATAARQNTSDPWAKLDSLMGAHKPQAQDAMPSGPGFDMGEIGKAVGGMLDKGRQNTLSSPPAANLGQNEPSIISKGVDAAGKALSGAAGTKPSTFSSEVGESQQRQDQQYHQQVVQTVVPILQEELRAGKPLTQILMEMAQHGIDHDTAMEALHHIYKNLPQNIQNAQGGSEGANPKAPAAETSYMPPGLLQSIETHESGNNPNAVSPAGAQGAFQFMPGTAKEYGVQDPNDIVQSARGAARYLSALGSEFHHNWAKAVAAYNAGQGAVEEAVKKHGDDWLKHLPRETQAYVANVLVGIE